MLFLLSLTFSGCDRASDDFESIRLQVCRGNYRDAIPKLEAYSGQHESRAGLFLGKCWLGLDDFDKARGAFKTTIRNYPETLEAHKCRYKLALLLFMEGNQELAKEQFQQIADRKDGPLVAEAGAFAKRLAD